jgi:hypothetical protein
MDIIGQIVYTAVGILIAYFINIFKRLGECLKQTAPNARRLQAENR